MNIKSVLCIFGGSQHELSAVNTAFILGKTYSASIRFLHLSPNPAAYVGLYGEGAMVSSAVIEAIEQENVAAMQRAKQYVASFAAKHHVPLDARDTPVHHASARFLHLTGMQDTVISREGRVSDIIVVGHNTLEPNAAYDTSIETALFNTGRPVLLLPAASGSLSTVWEDKTIALAWDGGLEAARGLYQALPLIEKAETLQLLIVREHGKPLSVEAEQGIMEYMRAHGITAHAIMIDAGNYRSIGEALLKRAKEMEADMLVMGAYGHSKLREMVLGGVTHYMLEKADIPLLLSH